MKKVIIAQLSIKNSNLSDFLNSADVMTKKSLEEDGCTAYTIYKSLANKNEFLIYENYQDEESVELHNSSDHFKNFLSSVMPFLVKEPVIELF